jgi:hypothetical protein
MMLDPAFRAAFEDAKRRIRAMDFRFVEERDQNAQALLEIYCTLRTQRAVQRLQHTLKARGFSYTAFSNASSADATI